MERTQLPCITSTKVRTLTRETLLDDVPICLTNVTVGWNISRPIVSNINLQIKKNSLTAIIGPVGSGKSTVTAPQTFWLLYSLY